MIKLCVLMNILTLIWAEPRVIDPPLRVDLQPPEEFRSLSSRNVRTAWINMPIDHFDPQNKDTYRMRFMFNDEFFGGDGYPLFILVGGEWDIVPGWLQGGNMYLMAQENKGYQIYTEHRFYGESLPYKNFTTENLRFLNVDQALADLAYFIKEIKKGPRFANSKVILYGGSYAGNMVLWFKQRYPHLVVGGVASSGPIMAKVDFTGYLEVVHDAFLSEGGEQCMSIINQGIKDTIAALATESGRLSIQRAYKLCVPLVHTNEYDLGFFSGLISWTFSTSVQQARPSTLTAICRNFESNSYGSTPMEQIGEYIAATRNLGNNCWQIDYKTYVDRYRNENSNYTEGSGSSVNEEAADAVSGIARRFNEYKPVALKPNKKRRVIRPTIKFARAWYYQTCTEYGYYQTAPRSGTVFDQLRWLSVRFYVDLCQQAFDQRFDEAFVYDAVERVNLVFGGLQPDVNNTINIHGTVDPWHALGVHDRDLKEGSPTITVPRASHCFDMGNWRITDTIRMTNAQQAARRLVAQWLSETV